MYFNQLHPKLARLISVISLCSMSAMPYQAIAAESNDIAAITNKLKGLKPPIEVRNIKPSVIPGMYEVFADGNMYYVDKEAKYVFSGTLYEAETKKNLTQASKQALTSIKFDSLPFKDAIEVKKGTGAYKFVAFSDPDCPFCKNVEQGLDEAQVTDYTAYIFLFPIKELHPEATKISENIWCSKNQQEAWLNYMVKSTSPENATCANPIERNIKLADKLGVGGTPTFYLNDGTQTQDPKELFQAITGKKLQIVR
ncbi:MAG: DsbC family protein [Methylophilus sp.]|nr:DsbC family protein [Methylophilus sp.]